MSTESKCLELHFTTNGGVRSGVYIPYNILYAFNHADTEN